MNAYLQNVSEFSTKQMKPVVRWTLRELGVDREDVVVRVKRTPYFQHSGRMYPHAQLHSKRVWEEEGDMPSTARHLLVGRIPATPLGRHDRKLRGGPPPIVPMDWKESLVCIIAHEGWHLWEFLHPRKGKEHIRQTKRGPVVVRPKLHSEVDAEWAEYRLLKRWRER